MCGERKRLSLELVVSRMRLRLVMMGLGLGLRKGGGRATWVGRTKWTQRG